MPVSGELILELDPDKLFLYEPHLKFLENGGYSRNLPVVNLNKAYVGSKFATFVGSEYVMPKEIFPTFTAPNAKVVRYKKKVPQNGAIEEKKEILEKELKRLQLCEDLDGLLDQNMKNLVFQRLNRIYR